MGVLGIVLIHPGCDVDKADSVHLLLAILV